MLRCFRELFASWIWYLPFRLDHEAPRNIIEGIMPVYYTILHEISRYEGEAVVLAAEQ